MTTLKPGPSIPFFQTGGSQVESGIDMSLMQDVTVLRGFGTSLGDQRLAVNSALTVNTDASTVWELVIYTWRNAPQIRPFDRRQIWQELYSEVTD